MILEGEKEAILQAIMIAEKYGYGNIISHLKRRWARKLVSSGISAETALQATNVSAYTDDIFGIDVGLAEDEGNRWADCRHLQTWHGICMRCGEAQY